MRRILAAAALLAGCSGNEARERWRYEKVLWENEPEIRSRDDARDRFERLAAARRLTLDECYRLALHRSESLALTGEELVRLETQFDQAVGSVLPRVSFKGSWTRQDTAGVAAGTFSSFTLRDRREYKVTAKQPIFNGLREFAAMRQASHLIGAKEHDLRHARLLLYDDVAQAFYGVLQAARDLETTQDTLNLARERLAELEERHGIGISRRSEVLAQDAEVASTEARLEEMKGTLEIAWETLQYMTGLRDRPVLADTLPVPAEPPPADALVAQATARRSDLESLRRQVDGAETAVRIAQSGYLPSVTLDADYFTHRDGVSSEVDWDLILSFELPLFDGLTTYAKIREAESSMRTAQLKREKALRDVALEIHRARADLEALRSERQHLEKAVASAQENYDLVDAEYRQNIVTNLEVLQAFDTLQSARLERDRSLTQLKLASIHLSIQGGLLPGDLK